MYSFNKMLVVLLLTGGLSFIFCSAEYSPEEKAILSVIDTFFQAMEDHDAVLADSILLADARLLSVREDSKEIVWKSSDREQFIHNIASSREDLLERIWEPRLLVHKQIAVVWASYDFYRDRKFSHSGVDAFNLIKTNNGWKISGIIYTVEPERHQKSPLGEPMFNNLNKL